jgi:uncharacterized protein YdhG (YjbR/CyaY superfamily)
MVFVLRVKLAENLVAIVNFLLTVSAVANRKNTKTVIFIESEIMQDTKFTTVEQYIAAQPHDIQKILVQMRNIVKNAAPNAEEVISYGMPAFKQNGMLVFYAVWKTHVGFYPSGSGIADFAPELDNYKKSKGAIQIPLDAPLPEDFISRLVKFRDTENENKAEIKAMAKKKK